MSLKRASIAGAAAALSALAIGAVPALADARVAPSVSFFAGHDGPVVSGSAHWTNTVSNDSDAFSIELDVPQGDAATFSSGYAGADLHHVAGHPAPAQEPTFDFQSTVAGTSGGSPRLVINFSDGGSANLRPLAWAGDTWVTEGSGATANDWDNSGGTCGYLYEAPYATVLGCHSGTTVTSAYVVTDSGWLYPAGYTNFVDNLQYGGFTMSQPSDNAR